MPWAIFRRSFDYEYRPIKPLCQHIKASDVPQSWPERIIAAAVEADCAERVDLDSQQVLEIRRAMTRR